MTEKQDAKGKIPNSNLIGDRNSGTIPRDSDIQAEACSFV